MRVNTVIRNGSNVHFSRGQKHYLCWESTLTSFWGWSCILTRRHVSGWPGVWAKGDILAYLPKRISTLSAGLSPSLLGQILPLFLSRRSARLSICLSACRRCRLFLRPSVVRLRSSSQLRMSRGVIDVLLALECTKVPARDVKAFRVFTLQGLCCFSCQFSSK